MCVNNFWFFGFILFEVVAYKFTEDAKLIHKSSQSANGTSTCYLTLDKTGDNLLVIFDDHICFCFISPAIKTFFFFD